MISSCSSSRPAASVRDVPLAHDRAGPRRQQHHPLRQPHRLADVVGHEQRSSCRGLPDAQELALQHVAGDRVERRERLVHQQEARLVGAGRRGQRPRERHPLPHAARQLVRPLAALAVEPDQRQQRLGPLPPLTAADAGELQGQLHVAARREPRQQRGLLEHERRPRRAQVDLAGGRFLQPGDEVEQRRLAAARRAEQADELAGAHGELDVAQRGHGVRAGAEGLADLAQHHGGRRELRGPVLHRSGHVSYPCALSRPAASTAGLPACVSTPLSAVTSMKPLRLVSLSATPAVTLSFESCGKVRGERVEGELELRERPVEHRGASEDPVSCLIAVLVPSWPRPRSRWRSRSPSARRGSARRSCPGAPAGTGCGRSARWWGTGRSATASSRRRAPWRPRPRAGSSTAPAASHPRAAWS